MSSVLLRSSCSVLLLALVAACDAPAPTGPDAQPQFAKGDAWTTKVSGGGKNVNGAVVEWISVHATSNAGGSVDGMYEYANVGIQDWRYKGTPDCVHVYAGGTKAIVIGPVTNTQGPDSPPLGTRVGFYIEDNGNGGQQDRAQAFFAGPFTCQQYSTVAFGGAPTSGNYTITTR